MMIKGIIFDLDGTLLNTVDDINNAINYVLTKYQFPNKSEIETKNNLGSGSMNLVKRSLPNDISDELLHQIHQEYQEYYQHNNDILTKPYDGILEVLKELRSAGYKIAVVSNKDDNDVKLLNQSKFKGLIDYSIGARTHKPVKPDPYLINIALEELHLLYNEVIYVGDSDVDILTAKNSNLKMITVSWGFRTVEVLKKFHAENIINFPHEILEMVEKIDD